MTVVEAMVAEIDGWDDDLRVNLPTAQHFQYRVLATNMREFLRRRIAGSSGHAAGVRVPETRTRTLGLTEMQIKDTGGIWGVSAWVSAAHRLRLRTCRLVTDRSHRPRSTWPNQAMAKPGPASLGLSFRVSQV